MRILALPADRINGKMLTQELISAGVPMRRPPAIRELGDDISRSGQLVNIVIKTLANNTEFDATVQQVLDAHQPPVDLTPAQVKRQQVRELIESDNTPESVRLRALVRVLYESLVEVRKRQQEDRIELIRLAKQLVEAGLPIQPITLKIDSKLNRSWAEAQQAVLDLANSEIQE